MKKENRAALIVDNRAMDALRWFPADRDLSYNDIVRTWYDTLYRMNIECDVLHAEALPERIDRYAMLVTPALYTASDGTTALLRSFVERGGVLVSSFRSFYADENLTMRQARLPYGLTDVFGVYHQEQSRPGKSTLRGLPIRYFEELLIPSADAEVERYEHPVWNRCAALSAHDFGKGRAWYVGCFCDGSILEDVFRRAADRAGIAEEDARFPVIVRKGALPDGRQLRFVLNYSETGSPCRCPRGGTELLTGRPVRSGEVLTLAPWGAAVLLSRAEPAPADE
jgi:beta-galactosidase